MLNIIAWFFFIPLVGCQSDIYHGFVEMENHFRRTASSGCQYPQFAVLHVKKRTVAFDKNSMPKNDDEKMTGWKADSKLRVFEKEKYIVNRPQKCHAEDSILSKQDEAIYNMVKSIEGKVDLMLFTQNAPCCMKAGKGQLEKHVEDRKKTIKDGGNGYLSCDAGSCTKIMTEFIGKFESKYPDIKDRSIEIHISWRQPYIATLEAADKTSKSVLQANDPIYYRLYFESLIDLLKKRRVRLWLLQKPWGISWFQKSLADFVIKKRDYNTAKFLENSYLLVNQVTSYCIRYGMEYLKKKPVEKFYPFADLECWSDKLDQITEEKKKSPELRAEDELMKGIILGYIKLPTVKSNIEERKWILGPPLNPYQGRFAKDVDVAIYSSAEKKDWYDKAFPKD